jgi:hypothetical protein
VIGKNGRAPAEISRYRRKIAARLPEKSSTTDTADQQTATAISKVANPLLLHLPLPTMNYLPSLAFATSPAHIERGATYEFVLNHVVDVDAPTELFRIELREPSLA